MMEQLAEKVRKLIQNQEMNLLNKMQLLSKTQQEKNKINRNRKTLMKQKRNNNPTFII